MTEQLKGVNYASILERIGANDGSNWIVIAAVNFEERSPRFLQDVLGSLPTNRLAHVKFLPFRLVSRRSSPWSALELVKEQFVGTLDDMSKKAGATFRFIDVEYPYENGVASEILGRAQELGPDGRSNLVIDISALPHRMCAFIMMEALAEIAGRARWRFSNLYVLETPPSVVSSRKGLGPFSVGGPQCVHHPELLRQRHDSRKTTMLVFPGGEGFEAKAVVDALKGHNSTITIAFPGQCTAFPDAGEQLISNQALLADTIRGELRLRYYFSELDALRVMGEVVMQAAIQCQDHPNRPHAFLIAPFGPKWAVALAAVAFRQLYRQLVLFRTEADIITDIAVLNSFQYVSLFSRGFRTPIVYHVVSGHE